ncbi:MAG: alpha/beta hydrolase fold domain-containing protein [Luteolibacter sp.]
MKHFISHILLWFVTFAPVLAAGEFTRETRVYKKAGGRELNLFIEKPASWKPSDQRPAMVFFFGGGWVAGKATQFQAQSEYLATRGMLGIRVEYRLIPKGDQGPPTVCCQDAKSAMRWVRAHAAELGVDPQRIAAAGGSAGGHLAAFATLVAGVDDPADDLKISPKANALVLFNPVFDNGPDGGWGKERIGSRYKEFSPAHNITAAAPPTLVFLGSKDELISVAVLERFKEQMTQAGVRCETHVYEGQPHGFFNREPHKTKTLVETDRFLTSLGWLAGEPTLKPAEGNAASQTAAEDQPALFTPAADSKGKWNFTADPKLPDVLIIGDSISIGYTRAVRAKLAGKANTWRPLRGSGPENCGDTVIGLAKIDGWLGKKKWDVIHFNWGLWDFCYRDPAITDRHNADKVNGKISITPEDYEKNLEKLVARMKQTGAKLVWASTTHVPEGEAGRFVGDDAKYNAIAARVMKKHDIPTNDLNSLTKGFPAKLFPKPGDVHYTGEGYQKIAVQVASAIEKSLPEKKPQ